MGVNAIKCLLPTLSSRSEKMSKFLIIGKLGKNALKPLYDGFRP